VVYLAYSTVNCTVTWPHHDIDQCWEALEIDADDVNLELWFQHDGVTVHTAAESVECLRAIIPDASCQVLATSPGRPGLLTYPRPAGFLWRHLKAEVYRNNRRTLKTWNRTSGTKVRPTDKRSQRSVLIYMRSQSQECIACQTYHVRDVISVK
jgi:hypothetical protein